MSTHDSSGSSVCIHAVCVRPAYRRRGIGLALLKEYIARLGRNPQYARTLLITHSDMRELYEKAGFEWLGRSKVVHGPAPWYEMRKTLSPPPPSSSVPAPANEDACAAQAQAIPANIWEALQRASATRSVPVAKLLTSFPHGVEDVREPGATPTNRHDLLCPREGCGSIILKAHVATLLERPSVQMEPSGSPNPLLPPLPPPPTVTHWWRVTPNAMAFENIGFSKSIPSDGTFPFPCQHAPFRGQITHTSRPDGKRLKLLSCAECDLGPLGWCQEGGSEFWLACNRVGYRS